VPSFQLRLVAASDMESQRPHGRSAQSLRRWVRARVSTCVVMRKRQRWLDMLTRVHRFGTPRCPSTESAPTVRRSGHDMNELPHLCASEATDDA
jgi:hypothetical protein